MALITQLFNRLQIPLAIYKTMMGPTKCLKYLGINVDTQVMETRLPQDQLTRITEFLIQIHAS